MTSQLSVPDSVEDAQKTIELARIWIVDGHQEIILTPHLWNDPASWGLLLVDVARHVAKHYARNQPGEYKSEEEILSRLKQGFDTEWDNPTE